MKSHFKQKKPLLLQSRNHRTFISLRPSSTPQLQKFRPNQIPPPRPFVLQIHGSLRIATTCNVILFSVPEAIWYVENTIRTLFNSKQGRLKLQCVLLQWHSKWWSSALWQRSTHHLTSVSESEREDTKRGRAREPSLTAFLWRSTCKCKLVLPFDWDEPRPVSGNCWHPVKRSGNNYASSRAHHLCSVQYSVSQFNPRC